MGPAVVNMLLAAAVSFIILAATATQAVVLFNDTNNMYSCINASGASSSYLISLGKMSSLDGCIAALNNYGDDPRARSFIYYPTSFADPDWRHYCYIRTDTWWTNVPQPDVISGQMDNFNQCFSDLDCELNGVCRNARCACTPTWTGNFCQYLNVKPGSKHLGYQREAYSQWGGDTRYDATTQQWVLYATEMYHECGINACCCGNSQIVRAFADQGSPGGPYTYSEVILPYFVHEPNLVYAPAVGHRVGDKGGAANANADGGLWLLSHWGNGVSSQVTPDLQCANGVTLDGAPSGCDSNGRTARLWNYISYATQLNASASEWRHNQMIIPGDTINFDLCPSNQYISGETGSVLQFWVERASWDLGSILHLMTSDAWNDTYTLHSNGLWINNLGDGTSVEDPYLWMDQNGNYHTLLHGMIFDPDDVQPWLRAAQGRHAYSSDGMHWVLSPHYTYNTTICYTDNRNECVNHCRRERPHLILDPDTNEPLFLSNGMQTDCDDGDKTYFGAVPLYTNSDYCKQGKTEYCNNN